MQENSPRVFIDVSVLEWQRNCGIKRRGSLRHLRYSKIRDLSALYMESFIVDTVPTLYGPCLELLLGDESLIWFKLGRPTGSFDIAVHDAKTHSFLHLS